ncbi:MAG: hypothetical protein IPI02_20030 [Sterolibacteriaceae bacterium]|nr:hypothetical protein [Sterolibacteriaceae bacterium]
MLCRENWQALDEDGEIVTKTAKHAWISSRAAARERPPTLQSGGASPLGIESRNLVEKHHGYRYEHLFAKNWNAMRGYHYLMRLAHLLNTPARFSSALVAASGDRCARLHTIRAQHL